MIHVLCRRDTCSCLYLWLKAVRVPQLCVHHASAVCESGVAKYFAAFPAAVLVPHCCREDTRLNCADLTCHYGLNHAYLMTVEVSKVCRATWRYAVTASHGVVGGPHPPGGCSTSYRCVSCVVVLGSVQVATREAQPVLCNDEATVVLYVQEDGFTSCPTTKPAHMHCWYYGIAHTNMHCESSLHPLFTPNAPAELAWRD
jgi:hypothetical protein